MNSSIWHLTHRSSRFTSSKTSRTPQFGDLSCKLCCAYWVTRAARSFEPQSKFGAFARILEPSSIVFCSVTFDADSSIDRHHRRYLFVIIDKSRDLQKQKDVARGGTSTTLTNHLDQKFQTDLGSELLNITFFEVHRSNC